VQQPAVSLISRGDIARFLSISRSLELARIAYAATATGHALHSSLGHVAAPDGEFHIKGSGLVVDGRLFAAAEPTAAIAVCGSACAPVPPTPWVRFRPICRLFVPSPHPVKPVVMQKVRASWPGFRRFGSLRHRRARSANQPSGPISKSQVAAAMPHRTLAMGRGGFEPPSDGL
jgi:hypothetical protein